jgi:Protein of unknown function (DUF3592)
MSTAVFVVVLVAGILAAQLMVWSSILVWFRRRRRVIASRLDSEMASETIIRSPEPGSYRGATVAGYPIVNNDGMIALTRRRLVFQTLTGKVIEVPVTDIAGVREAKVFKTAAKAGRQHLIIQTSSGEIGFYVCDNAAWIASLTTVGARPIAVGGSTAELLGEPRLDVPTILRKRRRARAIVAVVLTSVGLASGLVAGISAAVIAESISGNRYVDGTVVDLSDKGKGYAPVVEFVRPDSGAPVRFTGRLGSNPPAFRVGEHVGVRYNPDNPQDAVIDQYWQIWFLPTLFGIFSAPFLLGGIAFGVVTLAARRQTHL